MKEVNRDGGIHDRLRGGAPHALRADAARQALVTADVDAMMPP